MILHNNSQNLLSGTGICSVVLASICASSSASLAQDTENRAATDTSGFVFEEIFVTARKRSERLRDVPLAISSFTGDLLQAKGIQDTRELFNSVPNVDFTRSAGYAPSPIIRGVKAGVFDPTSEPSIGFYLNGVYLSAAGAVDISLLDIERVEVLRGPQGTLYGKNTLGGAVNIITSKPTDTFSVKGRGSYGNRDLIDASLSISGPVIEDKLSFRVAGAIKKDDGYLYNDVLEKNVEYKDYKGAIFSLRASPSDNFEASLNFDIMHNKPSSGNSEHFETSGPENCRARTVGSTAPTANCPNPLASIPIFSGFGYSYNSTPYDRTISEDIESIQDQKGHGISLSMNYDLETVELVSISGYRRYTSAITENRDKSAYPILDTFAQDYKTNSYSQELRINSTSDGPLGWTLGLFGFKDTRELGMLTTALPPARAGVFAAGPGLPIFATELQETTKITSTSYAVFGQGIYEISEKLTFTVGARYSWESRDIELTSSCDSYNCPVFVFGPGGFSGIPSGLPPQLQADSSSEEIFTPLMTLSYKPSADILTYITATRGYKSGGYAPVFTFSVRPFESESLWNYEVGAKTSWLDNRLTVNLSAFYMDWRDIQINSFTNTAGFVIQNAAKVINQGIELEVSATLTDNLQIGGSYGYLDSHYDTPIDVDTSLVLDNTRAFTPKHSVNLHIDYFQSLNSEWDVRARMDYNYKGNILYRADNVTGLGDNRQISTGRVLREESYSLVNARLGIENETWGIFFWTKNLFDEGYFITGSNFAGLVDAGYGIVGEPRSYGLEVSFEF